MTFFSILIQPLSWLTAELVITQTYSISGKQKLNLISLPTTNSFPFSPHLVTAPLLRPSITCTPLLHPDLSEAITLHVLYLPAQIPLSSPSALLMSTSSNSSSHFFLGIFLIKPPFWIILPPSFSLRYTWNAGCC